MVKSTDVQRTLPQTFSVADLLEWYRNGLINLTPKFQRRSVWKPLAKSFLIDTVIRGLPVPAIILRELPTDLKTLKRAREVVDGQQRLRTLFAFIIPHDERLAQDAFTISDAHQPSFGGFTFKDLPENNQTSILEFKVHTSVLPPMTTDGEVLNIFSRLNATGTKLKDQELRNAQFYGYFKTVSYDLAAEHIDFWLTRKIFTHDAMSRMTEVQFTSELLGVIIEGPAGLSQKNLNRLYEDNDANAEFAHNAPHRFRRIVNFLDEHLPWKDLGIFSRTSMFYPMFCAVHKSMPASERGKRWEASVKWKTILANARRLQSGNVPVRIRDSIGSQPTNEKERMSLITFLNAGA